MLTVDFDRLAVGAGDVVLDAGCGFGRHSMELLSRGAIVYSMDTDMESLRKTRYSMAMMTKEPRVRGSRYLVHFGDALNTPYKDESFDLIICAEVMEHVSDDDRACKELARVLKKNGRIAITVPTIFSEALYDVLTYEYFTSPGGHIRKYFPKELAAIMARNGLVLYGIGFKHAFHTVWWLIRSVVGLHHEAHPLTAAYHRFLHLGLYSGFMRRAESFFNYFFPKSIVLYAWKK
jgi:SAM-dependent methyltransferase